MRSIITDESECFICGNPFTQEHHMIFGNGRRKLSEKYGLKLPLCEAHHRWCHQDSHAHPKYAKDMKKRAQRAFEAQHGTRQDFMRIFRRNYLED